VDRLFTPWRFSYVTDASRMTPPCIFCDALEREGGDSLTVHVGERAFVLLNKFPYNNGHLMVVPRRHVGRLAGLTPDELAEMMVLARATEEALTVLYDPHGFNMGLNVGKPAGAGIVDHLHMHVVPRWDGDTSFMTIFAETRVLPEELSVTAQRVRAALKAIIGDV
jgi:ATP adenylyltransferase